MYNGYTSTTEQDKARWELMQANAEKRAAQAEQTRRAGETQPAAQEG